MPALVELVLVADEDEELTAAAGPGAAASFRDQSFARATTLDPGPWDPAMAYESGPPALGLLVLSGFLVRANSLRDETSTELVGAGDVIRPWDHDGEQAMGPTDARFTVLEPTRIAILDDDFARRVSRWPGVAAAILGRVGRRAYWLSVRVTISQINRTAARVLCLLSHLAERWGQPTEDGVVVPVGLTHARLAELTGSRRPSVTVAVGELQEQGVLRRDDGGRWVIPSNADALLDRMLADGPGREAA